MTTKKKKRVECLKGIIGIMQENDGSNIFWIDGKEFTFNSLKKAFNSLYAEDKILLTKYFIKRETQEQIAIGCGMSQPAVNRNILEALLCLEGKLFYGVESVEKPRKKSR